MANALCLFIRKNLSVNEVDITNSYFNLKAKCNNIMKAKLVKQVTGRNRLIFSGILTLLKLFNAEVSHFLQEEIILIFYNNNNNDNSGLLRLGTFKTFFLLIGQSFTENVEIKNKMLKVKENVLKVFDAA